jgi:hypothetical protein
MNAPTFGQHDVAAPDLHTVSLYHDRRGPDARPSVPPGARYVWDAEYCHWWLVREVDARALGHIACLMFERDAVARRVSPAPDGWRDLLDGELAALMYASGRGRAAA